MRRDRNPKNESKRNARDKYTVTEIKKAFDGLLGKLDIAEEESWEISTKTTNAKTKDL